VAQSVRRAIEKVVLYAGLVGLNSMDFLVSERGVSVLEVNPRPSATLELHDGRLKGGLMAAHVSACMHGVLPDDSAARMIPVRGLRVIYARRSLLANQRGRVRLRALGWCHDIARAGIRTGSGEPLCTVSASADSEEEVIARLARRAVEAERIHEEEDDE
jgi:predicted ATP-grasp superfamily ATP-dependent carboligase